MDLKLFLFLVSTTCLPLIIIYIFAPWDIPYIQYFFLCLIFVFRIVFFQEKEYKKKLRIIGKESLRIKLGRIPSESQVSVFINKKLEQRNLSFVIAVVVIFGLTIGFEKL
ncbi:MAG: hypothetical protein HN576_01000 [Bacteriovoracaceae bacterium]|jgi:hypothetical protein|nr:hypothetical protein [Bacteriovoracaceae bacterium]